MRRTVFFVGLTFLLVIGGFAQPSSLLLTAVAEEAVPEAMYMIEMRVVEGPRLAGVKEELQIADPGRPQATDARLRHDNSEGAVTPTPDQPSRLKSGPATLRDKADEVVVIGSQSDVERLWEGDADIKIVAAPKVALSPDKPVTVNITTKKSFTYLEAAADGRFAAKRTSPQDLGLTLNLEIQPIDDQSLELSRLEIQIAALDGREAVEGLETLEVGKPILSKRSLATTARLQLGNVRMVALPSGPKTHAVLLLRATRLEAPAKR